MSCPNCSATAAQRTPIVVVSGATKTLLLTVRDKNKQPVDLTGAKVWFTVKNRIGDVAACITKKNTAAGGVDGQILITIPQTGATKGQVKVFLVPADTAAMDPTESFWCDAWVQLATGERYQVVSNRAFRVDPAVTTSF